MSEPEVQWYIDRFRERVEEINRLTFESIGPNSIKEIIRHNCNEIEIDLYTIIRKVRDESRQIEKLDTASEQQSKRE